MEYSAKERELATSDGLEPNSGPLLRRALRLIAPYLLPRWTMVASAFVALLAGVGFDLLKPWPMKFVIDFLVKQVPILPDWLVPASARPVVWELAAVCLVILALAALSGLAAYFREFQLKRLGEEVAFELRVRLFGHIQRLSLTIHDSRRTGDMISRVAGDAGAVKELASTSILELTTAGASIVGMLGIMFWMDRQLALVGLMTVPVLLPVVWSFRRRIALAAKKVRHREVAVTSLTQETMSSIRLVKALGREKHHQQQFASESTKSVQAGLAAARLEAGYVWAADMIGAVGTCAVVWWGVQRILAGALQPGDLIVFVAYVRGLYSPMRDMAKQSIKISKAMVGLERVLEVLGMEPGVKESPHARPAPALRGHVEFQDVSFAYRSGDPVLHHVSFEIEPGQIVAIVGASGAGKSTILSLIPRLYDPSAGRILVDGSDVREFRLQSLRDQISFVLQESILLQTSIRENILYGRPSADAEDVEAAARAAGIDQFIDRLPDQYDTIVGVRGATLSGGERQRLAIARAMVRGAPILLLDEPTTGLDVRSEALVLDALCRLMTGKTTLLVTHKLSLIERAHRVLVVDAGRIVESGTHQELLQLDGSYAHMHRIARHGGELNDRTRSELVESQPQ